MQAEGAVRKGVREEIDESPDSGASDAADLACEVRGVTKSFGAVAAVDDVSVGIEPGSLTCLIGPNGAGKSTLLACVSGLLRVDAGAIVIEGRDVTRWTAHRRAEAGLGAVFQTTRPLEHLDVLGNAMVGCHTWTRSGFVEAMVRVPWQRREERRIEEQAYEALELVGLADRAEAPAGSLPLGQLRLLAVSRALAQRPRLLLLDEPAAGLRQAEKARLVETLLALKGRGLTQILVEHDMAFVGSLADRVVVLDRGQCDRGRHPRRGTPESSSRRGVSGVGDAMTLLELDTVTVQYGRAVAVDGVSLTVAAGERVALIGPNGAGKTSVINAACGVVRPAGGRVLIEGEDVTGSTPSVVVRRGISQVPEGRHVFSSLPIEANLLLGAYGRVFRLEIVSSTLRYLRSRQEVREQLDRVYDLLPKLRELRERPAGRTSGGEQQMVAIGRALMARPRLLAIDELSLGLAPLLVQSLAEFLVRLNDEEGVAILLVDQSASLAFSLCERAYVLETGRVALEGLSSELAGRPEVRSAYLGGGSA